MKQEFIPCEKCSKCIKFKDKCEGYELSIQYKMFYCPNFKEKKQS